MLGVPVSAPAEARVWRHLPVRPCVTVRVPLGPLPPSRGALAARWASSASRCWESAPPEPVRRCVSLLQRELRGSAEHRGPRARPGAWTRFWRRRAGPCRLRAGFSMGALFAGWPALVTFHRDRVGPDGRECADSLVRAGPGAQHGTRLILRALYSSA